MNVKELLDRNSSISFYKKGETIYHPETPPRWVYFIKSGKVKMVTMNNDGHEFIQGIFHSNDYFGEPALLLINLIWRLPLRFRIRKSLRLVGRNFSAFWKKTTISA